MGDEFDLEKLYKYLHDPNYIWADAYSIFDKVMDFGIKELYYKES